MTERITTIPQQNNKRAYMLQRHYSQNRSDNYYLLAFLAGCGIAGVFGQSAFVWGYSLGWASLFWSLYEFHGDTIMKIYNEKFNEEASSLELTEKEEESQPETTAEVSVEKVSVEKSDCENDKAE